MSLSSIKEKNRKMRHSFLDSKIENMIPKKEAEKIKKQVYYDFVKPVNETTLRNFYK